MSAANPPVPKPPVPLKEGNGGTGVDGLSCPIPLPTHSQAFGNVWEWAGTGGNGHPNATNGAHGEPDRTEALLDG